MHLERLELVDFRGYESAVVDLQPGVTVLVGANAQGKTNLLEAIHYLALGSSHRVASDVPLVRAGAEAAIVRADVVVGTDTGMGRRQRVEVELRPGGRSRARLNGQPQGRARDVIGVVAGVLFAPEDLSIVRGDPGERRRFLDDLLSQRRAAYHSARADYERILRQRTSLLRSARQHRAAPDATLATWTDQLATAGGVVLAARIAVTHALVGPTVAAYAELVDGSPEATASRVPTLSYRLSTGRVIPATSEQGVPDPAELAAELRAGFAAVASDEVERGQTLVGPHRDELELGLGGLPAKGYASHGEAWSLVLALRLASRDVLSAVGDEPVVLLDDVFAELDDTRRAALARRCADFEQVLVTAAVDDDVPLVGARHRVRAGTVTRGPIAYQPGQVDLLADDPWSGPGLPDARPGVPDTGTTAGGR